MSEEVHHKLYNYEITPPERAWEKIACALDSVPSEDFAAKLYSAEVTPPSTAWENIRQSLDSEKRRVIPFYRYAAAAAIIGLIAFGSTQLFKGEKTSTTVAEKTTTPSNNLPIVSTDKNDPVNNEPSITAAEEKRNDEALEKSKRTYAKLDVPRKKKTVIAPEYDYSNYVETSAPVIADNNITDRYIVLMTPDGNFIRMSKKLGNLVCCVSGEEQDEECKDQMEKWKKQLACSSNSHHGNFGDILSLLSSLQQDK